MTRVLTFRLAAATLSLSLGLAVAQRGEWNGIVCHGQATGIGGALAVSDEGDGFHLAAIFKIAVSVGGICARGLFYVKR